MVSTFDQQFLQSAAPLLAEQFGVEVQLVRSGSPIVTSATFTCSFSRVLDEVEMDEDALGTAAERRTWWPLKTDLVLATVEVEPRAGDILQVMDPDTDIATGEQHELAPNGTDRAVETHPDGAHYVVRSKKVA